MTDRARRSTETGTGVAPAAPAGARPGSPEQFQSFESDVTDVTPRPQLPAAEVPTPTHVDHATPTEVTQRAERSEPIRVISMKDATGPRPQRTEERRAVQVQLRSIAEVTRRHDTPVGLGHLAPPRDPRQARKRRLVDNMIWGCVAIMLACGIMLAIWLVAGR
jgi:hypothetical protein